LPGIAEDGRRAAVALAHPAAQAVELLRGAVDYDETTEAMPPQVEASHAPARARLLRA